MREVENYYYPLFFRITYTIIKKYYPGEPVNTHIQKLIIIIQEKNRVIITKRGKVKSPFFHGNVERLIPLYVPDQYPWILKMLL